MQQLQEQIEARRLELKVAAYEEWVRRVERAELLGLEGPSYGRVLHEFQRQLLEAVARLEWKRRCAVCEKLGADEPSFSQILKEYQTTPGNLLVFEPVKNSREEHEGPPRRYQQYRSETPLELRGGRAIQRR